jgi:3-oxoacyl-[acyl-carrier protein] reductase
MSQNPLNFKDQVVLVTGSSRGIGAAIAKQFAKYGAQVVLHYNSNESQAQKIAEGIKAEGGVPALCLKADVSSEDDIKNMLKQIKEQKGSLSVLINNAGMSTDGLLPRFRTEQMDKLWEVNLRSALLTSKHAFSMLSRAPQGQASILNMSSIIGYTGNAGQSVYAATKAGLIAVTKSLAKEYAARNIRVNGIAPGFIETDMTQSLPEETRQKYTDAIPLKCMGSVEDVASLCCFLSSPMAKYITGQTIVVDGGLSL